MTIKIMAIASIMIIALPASAQDIPSPYEGAIADHGQRQLESTLSKRRIEQAQQRNRPTSSAAARARAVCNDKERVASRHTPAKARELYSLCARAGY